LLKHASPSAAGAVSEATPTSGALPKAKLRTSRRGGNASRGNASQQARAASYSARLAALRSALHAAVRCALCCHDSGSAAVGVTGVDPVLRAFLGAWEELKAEQEARAEQEAQLFKEKSRARETRVLSQEVRATQTHRLTDHF
jgi:hypothetical protein